jgi:protein arginine kinase activator
MKHNCDFCNETAIVFLTQIVDGQMKKIKLCDGCAKEKGVTDPTGFSLADMLLGPFSSASVTKSNQRHSSQKCANCGFTAEDLNRLRRFGCSQCFSTFGDEVELILRGMHIGVTHLGKTPKGFEVLHAREEKLEQLKLALDDAISSEHYEQAAKLRDEIASIDLSLSVPGSP